MMITKLIVKTMIMAVFLVLMGSTATWAYCTWIETPSQAAVNEEVRILVFYAHPDDPIDERDTTELSLFAIAPDGLSEPVDLMGAAAYQHASLRFEQEGQWRLVLEWEPNRYRLQEFRHFESGIIWIGGTGTWVQEPIGLSQDVVVVTETQRPDGLVNLTLLCSMKGVRSAVRRSRCFKSLAADELLYEEVDEVESTSHGQVTVTVRPHHRYGFETDHRLPAR